MAFGLIQWLMSFVIFFVVLAVITWSAVHLGQKDHEFVAPRFLDGDDYSNRGEDKSLDSAIVMNATSLVTGSINDTAPFADHQGLQVSDSAQFYKMLQAISSTEERTVSSAQDDAAGNAATVVLASSVVGHDSAWNEDVTAAAYNMSAESAPVDHHWSIGESTRIPQTAHSTVPHGYREFPGTERLRKSDWYPPDETEFSNLSRDKGDGTSNTFAAFSYVRLSSDTKQTSTVKHVKRTDTTPDAQNERLGLETSTNRSYFYATVYPTEDS